MIGALLATGAIAKLIDEHVKIAAAARPWRLQLKRAALAHGVPESILVGVIWTESRFNPAAVGSAGERGMAQFLPIAARDIGVDWDQLVADPNVQIDAAAKYLRKLAVQFNWNVLEYLQAYNAGPGRAAKDGPFGSSYSFGVAVVALSDTLYSTAFGGGE